MFIVFEFTEKQEAVFCIFDELIDEDVCVIEEIRNNESLRKRINRVFPNIRDKSRVESALFMYGFTDFTLTPSPLELKRCWIIKGDSLELDDYLFNELLGICNLSEKELLNMVNAYKDEVMLEIISDFSLKNPTEFYSNYFRDNNPKLRHFIRSKFSSFEEARRLFGVMEELIEYRTTPVRRFINLGWEFERLLGETVFKDLKSQVSIGDCRPDFVHESTWIDAKLSKSTALDYRDNTIVKYREKADKVLIVYAVDDFESNPCLPSKVELKHVSEFYGDLNDEEIAILSEFINRAGTIKGISL